MFSESVTKQVQDAFDARFAKVPMPEGLTALLEKSTPEAAVCYKFCYAFMPVSDIASYPLSLFTQVVEQALCVRGQNLYGESIPDEIFLNFVLQCRINNENLEYNRDYFYGELLPRVQGLSAADAVLAVNYWCLEKVTYIGNSPRTMSPFTIMKNTQGRCGEESVFTVSALRSVGIPARQIYTPLWAHCESNHAWVEVYVGGRWHFIGACEPEPVLDKGWFTGPASKGIIIHARVFSTIPPVGEEVAFKTDSMCEVNRTNDYVQHHVPLKVKVNNGNQDVRVTVKIVAHCTFANMITLTPDKNGVATVTIGQGDLLIHVTDGKKMIARRVDTRLEHEIEVDFAKAVPGGDAMGIENGADFILTPPFSDYQDPNYGITPELQAAHEAKLAHCHEVRNAYAATFADEAKGKALEAYYGSPNFDSAEYFVKAKGNLDQIVKFVALPQFPLKYKYMMLRSFGDAKDFTDSAADILAEHLEYALPFKDDSYEEIFEKYVLCPRIALEMVTPYRKVISAYFSNDQKAAFAANPLAIWQWIQENIIDTDEYRTGNDQRTLMASPVGLLRYKYGGLYSRGLLFAAICRTIGVPARYHFGHMEYYTSGQFTKLVMTEKTTTPPPKVDLTITDKNGQELSHYRNFTVAKLENGHYSLVGVGYGRRVEMPIKVEPGDYQIVTGRRLESGAMAIKVYHVKVDGDTTVEVEVPPEETAAMEPKPIGDYQFDDVSLTSLLSGKDLVACIRPSHEPTEHLLRELLDARPAYKRQGVKVVLVATKDNANLQKVVEAYEEDITVIFVADDAFGKYLADQVGIVPNLPVVAMVGEGGNALYYVQGYHVGSVGLAVTYVA
ncbi:MAG: transglutaminase-like domain-containing protein [Defluviitaleaceae bacterium]|nr:transglutaminase-like domain-containing protein [Defluviitaleaceae bacterium]